MDPVLVPLADGFEEIEAIAIIDVLRRAKFEVLTASLKANPVTGAHGIVVVADTFLDDVIERWFSAVVLPGGMPGSRNLRDDSRMIGLLQRHHREGRLVSAICAAPMVLEAAGVLEGRRATAYPDTALPSARFVEESVVVDGNLVTSRGPGTALLFALELVARLGKPDQARRLQEGMLVTR